MNTAVHDNNLYPQSAAAGYCVHLSPEIDAWEWDAFLARTPGGHHVQTSMWARVKSTLGWDCVRFTVRHEGRIVAGAQLLMRRFAKAVVIGIVSKGPVVVPEDPMLGGFVVDELVRLAMDQGVQCLVVQPPNNGEAQSRIMRDRGFHPTDLETSPTATIQIDLKQDMDAIFAGMKKKSRRYIRHGLNSGIIGREGTADNLHSFYQLLTATSKRHKWAIYPENYFAEIYRIFGELGHAKLFFTEYKGEALSSQLLIAFGDTVITKNSGWSGQFGNLGANNVLEWISIQWAKAQGYRYYDLEGIDPKIAISQEVGSGKGYHEQDSWSSYKHQYGGRVISFPKEHV
jgi:lipid II:glycine glycyltransferase (peptidoglycan interpeptide bridge formation enzyme)